MDDKLLYKIAITQIPTVGPITARNLIAYSGGVEEVFALPAKELLKIPGIGQSHVEALLTTKAQAFAQAEAELGFIEKYGITPLFYLDAAYPARLKPYQDSPVMLYTRGNMDLDTARVVAIVGTRQPTPYGIGMCEELVEQLQPYGALIVSGLAYGVDVTAHRKCIEIGVPTVGALGHGLRQIYPALHSSVAERMAANGGLVTEYTSHTPPDRENFPMRNRIIAGLCDALVVIETATKGGSMISANMAKEYHKDIFAVPGRAKDKYAQGCNLLIKTQRAKLLESAEDLAKALHWKLGKTPKAVQAQLFPELNEEEASIVSSLRELADPSIDQLMYKYQKTSGEMAALLLELEFKGVVRSLPGKRYVVN